MLASILLPDPANLELCEVAVEEDVIILTVRSLRSGVACPDCQHPSERVHSRYWREGADLPCAEYRTELHLLARRFFCDN